jgi:hypothetical protein
MTIGIKCPSCGAEPGQPCLVDAGMSLFHQSRIRAANPRHYDSPCQKCNELQKRVDDAGDTARAHVFGQTAKPKSRWPKALREMVKENDANVRNTGEALHFHKAREHHEIGTRVEKIGARTLAEMLRESRNARDPSEQGTVVGVGYLNGKQTVAVKFDNETFSASNAYADEFRKLN